MAAGFVQLVPDGTGKKVQTFRNTIGADVVEAQAVALVNSIGVIPSAMTWVSLKSAAPSASAVQADTGALVAGDYDFDINLCAADTIAVGKGLVIEHRNAANGATLFNLGGIPAGEALTVALRRYTIATNERIRVIAGTAAGAASSMYVSAIGRRVA